VESGGGCVHASVNVVAVVVVTVLAFGTFHQLAELLRERLCERGGGGRSVGGEKTKTVQCMRACV
jgi:hypothetical protein